MSATDGPVVHNTDADCRTKVLAKIETIFEDMADVLLNERGQMSMSIRRRSKISGSHRMQEPLSEAAPTVEKRISFPGKTEKEAWQFSELVTRL